MFLKRFYNDQLAQASYLVGCQATGEAIVIDPLLDWIDYLHAAEAEGLRVTHVTETHIHADFVSGARALAGVAGARLYLSAEGGPGWEYGYAAADGATLVRGGDRIMVGNVALDVVHTPGHTPEHLSFVLTDTPAGAGPMGVFTGDFVFVGDVGRPDLLERAAGQAGTMDAAARALFRSLGWFRALPDHLQLWPGHGAGSACGKALGAVPSSTVGYERVANWALRVPDEDAFVREVLAGQPAPPRYFAEMKRVNRDGPPTARPDDRYRQFAPATVSADQAFGDAWSANNAKPAGWDDGGDAPPWIVEPAPMLVDVRPTAAFAAGHVRGAVNAPWGGSFMKWAGALLDPASRSRIVLIGDRAGAGTIATIAGTLHMVGFDDIWWCNVDSAMQWAAERGRVDIVPQIEAGALAAKLERGEVTVVDVRNQDEWDAGHLPGAMHVPLATLAAHVAEIPTDRPVVVQCQGGGRSSVAASLLRAVGREDVSNLTGGFGEWARRGMGVERSQGG